MRPDRKNLQDALNRSMPAAQQAELGDMLQEMIEAYNDLATKHNDLVTFFDGLSNGNWNMVPNMIANASLKNVNDRGQQS